MKPRHLQHRAICWAAFIGILAPAGFVAATEDSLSPPAQNIEVLQSTAACPPAGAFTISDVALASGGLLTGQVRDKHHRPESGVEIRLQSGTQTIALTQTDSNGVFAVAGLHGGMHQIVTGDSVHNCRLWVSGTAPPNAVENVQIVPGSGLIRGQWGPPPGNRFLQQAKVWSTNPFVVGGVVAAAVAIPVAINNADKDDPPSS